MHCIYVCEWICVYIYKVFNSLNNTVSELHMNLHANKFSVFSVIRMIHCFQNAPFKSNTNIENPKASLAEFCAAKYGEWSLWY